jgi:glucan-binding YG repeat protein
MIKRMSKVTSLLVAAAAMASLMPAIGANAATTQLPTQEGTIENAIAYANGSYVYQGYKGSDSTDGVYYNNGTQDKSLDELSSADVDSSYGSQYAFTNDGSDQYLVDLTTGDVTDNTTPVDDADTAATKLQTKLKKTDRYGQNLGVNGALSAEANLGGSVDDNKTLDIPGNKFGDIWYAYSVPTKSSDAANYVDKNGNLYGFTDASGNYIDASYTANIYAYSTKEGKTVEINNFSNSYGDVDSDSGLLATLVKQPVALAQDQNNIYALVTVAITDTASNAAVTGGTTTDASAYVNDINGGSATTTIRTYVQKISKAQGDQENGAYIPKSVQSYEVGNANSEYDSSDATDAYNAIKNAITDAGASINTLADVTQADVQGYVNSNGAEKPLFTVNNGNLVAIQATSDKIDAFTLNFKQDKVKYKVFPAFKDDTTDASANVSYFENNKVDAYLLEKDSDDSVDLNNNSNTIPLESYDVDVNGNVWVVADGKIYEYTNGSMTETYTCDSSIDSISAYDANNIVAWQNSGNIYTTIGGASQDTTGTGTSTGTTGTTGTTTATAGWVKNTDGTWSYNKADGTKATGWVQDGAWYYLNANGIMATGWVNDNGTWYYLNASGAMSTGWVNDNGTWYYLNGSGAMATGWVNDNGTWYYLKSSGAMATGWVNDNGTWYYLNASGAMLANTTVDGYVLGASGAWIK